MTVSSNTFDVDIDEARRDMAALFRWTARERLHEGIANHFSMAVSADGQQFLMNPYGIHFSKIKASDLLILHAQETPAQHLWMKGALILLLGVFMALCIVTTLLHA